ncbi:MAG: PPK2 family polyphosphate kinase [Pseudomonadota bacterium]
MRPWFNAVTNPYLAPFDGSLRHGRCTTKPPRDVPDKKELRRKLKDLGEEIDELQRMLYAGDQYSVLLVFQALDAAGKDGTIRAVFNQVDPAGIRVTSFKRPTTLELEHDFLWRCAKELPRRGNIGIFNRSYYEEVLAVRVHPEYLKFQNLPPYRSEKSLWEMRYEAIRQHELHLVQSGTVVVKFWLKHSREEQRQRFLSRLNEPEKNWKFAVSDVKERGFWSKYMSAFQAAINATSRPWAPWYVIPADSKSYMRVAVAETVRDTLKSLNLSYPVQTAERQKMLAQMRRELTKPGS